MIERARTERSKRNILYGASVFAVAGGLALASHGAGDIHTGVQGLINDIHLLSADIRALQNHTLTYVNVDGMEQSINTYVNNIAAGGSQIVAGGMITGLGIAGIYASRR